MPDVQNTSLSKIIKRLELIKSLISLEEEGEIHIKENDKYRLLAVQARRQGEGLCMSERRFIQQKA